MNKKIRFSNIILAILAILVSILFTEDTAISKCAYEPYAITGTVQEYSSKILIQEAKLYFFFDDYQSTMSRGYETKYPDFFTTDANGVFTATAYFDTLSGGNIFTGDRCNRKPQTLTVIITAHGYLTTRRIYNLNKLEVSGSDFNRSINLPIIYLYKSAKK